MASVESGQLVWGPYRQCVRQWGRQREKKTLLSCQRMIFPWGLEQRRPTEIWRRCSNLIPSGGKKKKKTKKTSTSFKRNPTRGSNICSLVALVWSSCVLDFLWHGRLLFWLIPQVSSVLWPTAAQIHSSLMSSLLFASRPPSRFRWAAPRQRLSSALTWTAFK